jgi:hypothetical protein
VTLTPGDIVRVTETVTVWLWDEDYLIPRWEVHTVLAVRGADVRLAHRNRRPVWIPSRLVEKCG